MGSTMKLRSRSIRREVKVTTPAIASGHKEPTSPSRIRSKSSSADHKGLKVENEQSSSQPRTRIAGKSSPANSSGRSKKLKKTAEFENVDMDKFQVMEVEDEPNRQIPELPQEMKLEILKKFVQDSTTEEKKIASLVCKEWERICRKDFKLSWPELCDETAEILESTKFDFAKVAVTKLIDVNFPSKVFTRGSQVRTLIFLTPNVTPLNMTALARAFPNIKRLWVDLTRESDARSTKFITEDLRLITAFLVALTEVEIQLRPNFLECGSGCEQSPQRTIISSNLSTNNRT